MENEWIDVCDRLPEPFEPIYINSTTRGVRDGALLARRSSDGKLNWKCSIHSIQDVTHWMPKEYPKPPRHERFKAFVDADGRTYLNFKGDGFSCSIQLVCVEECPETLVRWLNDRIIDSINCELVMEHLGSR